MVKRAIMAEVRRCAREFPVVTVFGPRQSGKSTLARLCLPDKHSRKIIPIEIKSSETFNTDFHKGIAYFHKLVPSSTPGFILYNGERDTEFHGTLVTNPLRMSDDDILK